MYFLTELGSINATFTSHIILNRKIESTPIAVQRCFEQNANTSHCTMSAFVR